VENRCCPSERFNGGSFDRGRTCGRSSHALCLLHLRIRAILPSSTRPFHGETPFNVSTQRMRHLPTPTRAFYSLRKSRSKGEYSGRISAAGKRARSSRNCAPAFMFHYLPLRRPFGESCRLTHVRVHAHGESRSRLCASSCSSEERASSRARTPGTVSRAQRRRGRQSVTSLKRDEMKRAREILYLYLRVPPRRFHYRSASRREFRKPPSPAPL